MQRRVFLRTGFTAVTAAAALPMTAAPARSAQPRTSARQAADPIRLNSNENPLGISESARRAVIERGMALSNQYPDAQMRALQARLASIHDVAPESIVLGNGSTEVLQMAVQAMAPPGARLIMADPTYEDVPGYAEPYELELVQVPLTAGYGHDLERMEAATRGVAGPALVYICNPNNPTGTVTASAAVDAWIERAPENVVFLVDEAYIEYVDDPAYHTALPWIASRPNVIVARTFSKVYGMAGLRLGYAIAHPDTARRLDAYRAFVNINQHALAAADASLSDPGHVRLSLESNAAGKRVLLSALDELGLEHIPSHTNFVMHRVRGELDTYIERMREHGFRVGRPFPPMLGYNRLSIGTPEQMARFADTLQGFRSRGWV